MRQSYLLKACIFATGCAGIVAEFTLSTLASYLLGNTTLQWAVLMSLMLFAMGLGSRWSRLLTDRLLDRFIAIEFYLSVLCATCAVAAYFGSAFVLSAGVFIYSLCFCNRRANRHGNSAGRTHERSVPGSEHQYRLSNGKRLFWRIDRRTIVRLFFIARIGLDLHPAGIGRDQLCRSIGITVAIPTLIGASLDGY